MSPTRAAALVFLPTLTFAAVLIAGSASKLRAAASEAPVARCVGVMVNPPLVDAAAESASGMPLLAFQNSMAKTKLAFVVENPGGGIVGFARDESLLEMFADSTGQPLFDPDSAFSPFGFSERIIRDGKRLALELDGDAAPREGATHIRVKGELGVRIAHERQTVRSKPTRIAAGESFSAGPFELKVLRAEDSSWGEGYDIELETNSNLRVVISYALVTGEGDRVELRPTSTMTFMDKTQITLEAPDEVKSGSFEFVAWKGAQVVQVPFDTRVRVGIE